MPVKRYIKIGRSDDLNYFIYRKSVETDKIIIILSGIETRDEAEGFLEAWDPLTVDNESELSKRPNKQ